MIKILALTKEFDVPSTRLRIINIRDYIKEYDIKIEIKRFPGNIYELYKLIHNGYDFIWLQKKFLNLLNYLIFKISKIPIIFDFDDNLLVRMKPKNGSYYSKTREKKFQLIKNISYAFTCGNNFLKNQVIDTKKPILIYPTPLNPDVPKKDKKKINNPLIIGWVGLSGGFIYLDKIMDDLKRLYKERKFILRIISDKDYPKKYEFIENKRWDIKTQDLEISKFDIGIMPLNINSPFDKGKCSYKLLQYMAAGVIAVGEAYGNNLEVIDHKKNGFLIKNGKWYEGLKEVIDNLSYYYTYVPENAIKKIEENFSYKILSKKLSDFFIELYNGRF